MTWLACDSCHNYMDGIHDDRLRKRCRACGGTPIATRTVPDDLRREIYEWFDGNRHRWYK